MYVLAYEIAKTAIHEIDLRYENKRKLLHDFVAVLTAISIIYTLIFE